MADDDKDTTPTKAPKAVVSKKFPLEGDHFYGVQMVTRRSHNGSQDSIDESAIRRIQKAVKVEQTGTYDRDTAAAVLKYQQKNDLDPTGYVDADTWKKPSP